MNRHTYHTLYRALYSLLALAVFACDTTISSDEAQVGAAVQSLAQITPDQVFEIDTANSSVTWIGAKVTGRHNGIFKIQEGEVTLHNGTASGGKTVFDMTGMRSDDKTIDEANNKKLTRHLRSPDFFDVEQHPTAIFEITSVSPYEANTDQEETPSVFASKTRELRIKDPTHRITGNLTIKGITRSVSFPAKITLEDSVLKAKANFNINRSDWNLTYGADKSLGNQTIHPTVNIGLDIVALRQ
jgi:polyisoprenoid-binding protein YceI